MAKKYNFRAWLKTMPDDKVYDFNNCSGNCAMGQYMSSIGETWDIGVYNEHIKRELKGSALQLSSNNTFGGLKRALEVV